MYILRQTQHLANSSEDKEKTKHGVDNPNAGHRSYPVCYKQTGPHRPTTVTGTVTLSQEAGETVFLKSRRRKNAVHQAIYGLIFHAMINSHF